MTELNEIYKCNVCGNMVEVIHPSFGELVCCSVPMHKLDEKKEEEGLSEKHVPVVVFEGDNKIIRIGSIPHPMEKDHHIVFIEAISPDGKYLKRKYLEPGELPELKLECKCKTFTAREFCNIHGLFKSECCTENKKEE